MYHQVLVGYKEGTKIQDEINKREHKEIHVTALQFLIFPPLFPYPLALNLFQYGTLLS